METQIENYIDYLNSVKHASANTIASYRRDLKKMSRFFADRQCTDVREPVSYTHLWDGFTVEKDFRGKHLHIEVKNPGHAESGFKSMEINGQTIFNNYVKDEWLIDVYKRQA